MTTRRPSDGHGAVERRRGGRQWYRMEVDFLRDEMVEALGERFGACGPLAFVAFLGAAKARDDGGAFVYAWGALRRSAYVPDEATARAIVAEAVEWGALEVVEDTPLRLRGVVVNFDRYQRPADPTAAKRKREQRDRERDSERDNRDIDRDTPDIAAGHAPTRTRTPTEESKLSSKRASTINQDCLPDDFPDALTASVDPVLERLFKIHSLRGGNVPTRRGVGLKLAAYPARDHLDVAERCVYWATAGRGLHQRRKDWVAVYGTFLDGSPDATPQRLVSTEQATDGRWWAGALAREREETQS